ncbi:MAG TPA: hypothetical protein PK264_15990 [Hyphomicrobiaceae bacterium]|nr:hypothetical protein [Hyphomicrobiaceae bacterium]
MIRTWRLCLGVLGLAAVTTGSLSAAEPKSVDLLKHGSARIEHASDALAGAATLKALTDGDLATPVPLAVSAGDAVTLTFAFAGGEVSPEAIEVSVGSAKREEAAAAIDVLVSSVSPHAGYRSVRADPLKAAPGVQRFTFTPAAATFVMLKLTAPRGAPRVAIAEVRLIGRLGPPQSNYKFGETPAKALDVIQSLAGIGTLDLSITPDEASLFEDARDGKLDRWSFAEAALIVSGVRTKAERARYLSEIDAIEAEARRVTASEVGAHAKGGALLPFLHKRTFAKGYVSKQTDVSTILSERTFNCVSSAALYNIVGRRLGLDLRAIEVPDHALSILYEGTSHADVETTTPRGFNPGRDRSVQDEFKSLTGFAYIPDSNRDQRREVGELGLLALIYYNHGVGHSNAKRPREALLAYFRAMSLDPEFGSAVKNALATLANWSHDLSKYGQYEEALKVAGLGLRLAPKDATLLNNNKAVWSIWADSLIKAGRSEEALAVLLRAASAVPDGGFQRMQAWVYIHRGEQHIKAGEWQAAAALGPVALARLEGGARDEMARWVASLHGRRVQGEIKAGRFAAALDLIAARITEAPREPRSAENLGYVVQELLKSVGAKEGTEAAERLIPDLLKRFAGQRDVTEVAVAYFHRTIGRLENEGRYDDALAVAGRMEAALGDVKRAAEARAGIVDRWALKLAKAGSFAAALDVYEKAYPTLASKSTADNNIRYIIQEWTKAAAAKGGSPTAEEILAAQTKRFAFVPGLAGASDDHVANTAIGHARAKRFSQALDVYAAAYATLKDKSKAHNNILYVLQEWTKEAAATGARPSAEEILAKELQRFSFVPGIGQIAVGHVNRLVQAEVREKRFEAALAVLKANAGVLPDPKKAEDIAAYVYDSWAKTHRERGDWQAVVDLYNRSLEAYPGSSHLRRNAIAAWYGWSKVFMDKKDWRGAITIYENALKRFPGESLLEQNLKYCREQLAKSGG